MQQVFWNRSASHLQRPCDIAGVFDKPYIVMFICFSRWRELYAFVGWAFCAACGADGVEYCAIARTDPLSVLAGDAGPAGQLAGGELSAAAAKKRKRERDRASPTNTQQQQPSPPVKGLPLRLPPIKLTAALDMARTTNALQALKADKRQFRDAVRTLLRPAEMLLTVLATPPAAAGALLQEIRPLITAAADLYYCEGTAADDVLRYSTLMAQEGGWDCTCTMADLMEKPVQVLRTVDMLIVALSKHLDRCDPAGLKLRVEYGTTLECARAKCWIAYIPAAQAGSPMPHSYRPLVQWLHDWAKRTFSGAARSQGVRLDAARMQDVLQAATGHPELASNIHRVLTQACKV